MGPDGGFVWIGGKGRVMVDEAGKPIRMVGSATDISERHRVDDALRALLRVSERLNSTLDVDGILHVLLEEAILLADAESGVWRGSRPRPGMFCRIYLGDDQEFLPESYLWPPGHGRPELGVGPPEALSGQRRPG